MDKKVINLEQYLGATDNRLLDLNINTGSGKIKNMDGILCLANNIEENSRDILAKRKDLEIVSNGNLCILYRPSSQAFPFSNWSLGQICDVLGVPAMYVRKCLDEEELDLAVYNMNKWLRRENQDKEFLLRITADRVHGFLSSRYGIMDDKRVLEIVNDTVSSIGDYTVKNTLLTPEMMNIRVVDNKPLNDSGTLSVALNIKNSRVGQASLDIRLMVYNWICSNGVIFGGGRGTLYSRQHRGAFEDAFAMDFGKTLANIPRIVAQIKEWVEKAKGEGLDDARIQSIIDKLKKEDQMSIPIVNRIIELIPKYSNTIFGVAQAATEIAQDYSIDTRERLETWAGDIIMAS
jgi:hypothetical protein